jgi:hypothetical protein
MGAIVATVDKAAFQAEVQKMFQGTPLFEQIQGVAKLKWPDSLVPPGLFTTIGLIMQIVGSITASVEIVKQNIIKEQDPDGTKGVKFDKALALETAVDLLDSTITLEGFVGSLIEKFDKPILMLLISVYVQGKTPNWADEAKKLVGIA